MVCVLSRVRPICFSLRAKITPAGRPARSQRLRRERHNLCGPHRFARLSAAAVAARHEGKAWREKLQFSIGELWWWFGS